MHSRQKSQEKSKLNNYKLYQQVLFILDINKRVLNISITFSNADRMYVLTLYPVCGFGNYLPVTHAAANAIFLDSPYDWYAWYIGAFLTMLI